MSLGGLNGLNYALQRPDSVSALVAVDVGPWVNIDAGLPIREFMQEVAALDRFEEIVAAALRLNPRRDARVLRHSLWHNLRRCPDGRLMWKTDLRRTSERGASAYTISDAQRSSCGAVTAKSSASRMPGDLRKQCHAGAGSRSKAPATPSRAISQKR